MSNYSDVVSMMNGFLQSIEAERAGMFKSAADAPTPGPNDDAKNIPEIKQEKKVPNMGAGQGAAGKEMQQDADASINGIPADSAKATNNDGDGAEPTDNQGPKSLEADQPVTENITVENTAEKIARAERLGNAILSTVAGMRKSAGQYDYLEKLASQHPGMVDPMTEAYHAFSQGWQDALAQREADRNDIIMSGLAKSAEEADAILDQAALQDPEAILPAGVQSDEGDDVDVSDMDPETVAAVHQLAQQMEAQGVTPEDLDQAAQTLDELQSAGVEPEEIVAAAQAVDAEGGAPAAAAAPEAAEAVKEAAIRHEILKDYIRNLRG